MIKWIERWTWGGMAVDGGVVTEPVAWAVTELPALSFPPK